MSGYLTRRRCADRGRLLFPDYPLNIYRTVFAAMSRAWATLLGEEGDEIFGKPEPYVTACLQEALEDLRSAPEDVIPGFTSCLFETVHRDASLTNYDSQNLEKKPDLTFRLIDRHPGVRNSLYRGIFVECKRVNLGTSPVRLYCVNGISRFVRGEYAWAMPTGVMVAYASDGCTVENRLAPYLEERMKADDHDLLETRSAPLRWESGDRELEIYSSKHGRTFSTNGIPGELRLLHHWLSSSKAIESEPAGE